MANYLKLLREVIDTGRLNRATNIKDLYKEINKSGNINYKDFKKWMHDYGIYGSFGKHDMARLSGMYYGSKSVDSSSNKEIPVTIDTSILKVNPADTSVLKVNPTIPTISTIPTIAVLRTPIVKSSGNTSNNSSNDNRIYADPSTAAWRDYSTGTSQNPTLVAGNGNGPGTGFSRLDKRGNGPDNTVIIIDKNGNSSYAGNYQISGGNLSTVDPTILDQLGLLDHSTPSVTKSIEDLNEQMYGSADLYDNLTAAQLRDFSNWRKMHGNKGTVEEYLRAIKPSGSIKELNPVIIAKHFIESRNSSGPLYTGVGRTTLSFQQGGQVKSSNKEQDAVMQFVQALAQTLQADPNQVILAAQLNPDALKSAVEVYQQTLDIQQAALAFSQALQSQTQAAKHGAKLNYLKALKNQCADDEELVYFKKGGKVGCGCKKKEDGGELKSDKKESAVDKFKKMAKGDKTPLKSVINKNDTIHTTTGPKRLVDKKETMKYPKFDHTKATQAEKDRASEKDYYRGDKDHGDHDPVKKDCGGSKMKLKKGDKVCPKCGKVHAAGAGCMLSSVKKFKMHKLGGSLKGVPFIRMEMK